MHNVRTGPVHFFLGGGGGSTHILGMFCPNRRIHARIRASPENLAERGAPKMQKFYVFYKRFGIGVHAGSNNSRQHILTSKQKEEEKKGRPNICPNYIRTLPEFRPIFYIGKFF